MQEYNSVRGDVGSYDWAHPNNKQGHYRFTFRSAAPEEIKKTISFILGEQYFTNQSTPLAAAYEIQEYAEKCLYNSDKEAIKPVIAYLESLEYEDTRDELLAKRERLQGQLAEVEKKLEKAAARCEETV